MEKNLKFRMYSLVLKQLNPIQKGVQTTHGVIEYVNLYDQEYDYIVWSRIDKTLVILDGGTTPEIDDIISELKRNMINFSLFKEEDLGELTTCVCFLASEHVWNEKYEYLYENPELLEVDSQTYKDYILKKIINKCRIAH